MRIPHRYSRGDGDKGDLAAGTPIGICSRSQTRRPICIPLNLRLGCVVITGVTGTGKSALMEKMILDDVQRGCGVLVLDPHGSMTARLLHLLPKSAIEKTVYIKPADPDWVPVWNPMQCTATAGRNLIVDGLARVLVDGIPSCSARIEHVLRQALFSVLHVPGGTLLDVVTLMRSKSVDGRRLRARICRLLDNECAISFWKYGFPTYTQAELSTAQWLVSRLLITDGVGAMLSEPTSAFTLDDAINKGKVVLVDFSAVGPDFVRLLGGLLLASLFAAVIGRRAGAPEQSYRPFHVYCDEAHRFVTRPLQDLCFASQKLAVGVTLAQLYLGEPGAPMSDLVSLARSSILFRVEESDAEALAKDLQQKVTAEELMALDVGEAIARIGNHVVRLKTFPPVATPRRHFRHFRDEIVDRSHQLYCIPSERILRALR